MCRFSYWHWNGLTGINSGIGVVIDSTGVSSNYIGTGTGVSISIGSGTAVLAFDIGMVVVLLQ